MKINSTVCPFILLIVSSPCFAQREKAAQNEVRWAQAEDRIGGPSEIDRVALEKLKESVARICGMSVEPQMTNTLPTEFSLGLALTFESDGSVSKPGPKVFLSSSSSALDQAAVQLVLEIGDANIFRLLSWHDPTTMRFFLGERIVSFSVGEQLETEADADTRATSLQFMFKIIAATQRTRNPIFGELFSSLRVRADGRDVEFYGTLSRARVGEILAAWVGKPVSLSA